MKVVINKCYGGFGLSRAAYEWLIANGIPAKRYIEPKRDAKTGLYGYEPDELCIYDRSLTPRGESTMNDRYWLGVDRGVEESVWGGRYWDAWARDDRENPLLVQCVYELGSEVASSSLAKLKVVEIPDNVEYTIEEHDGMEHVAQIHSTWA